jgi:hypothetical protein
MAAHYSVDIPAVQSYVSMAGLATPPLKTTMVDLFARRLKLPTRAICMTDVLSPLQVRTFSDCEVRWFYEHLLGLPDPPTATMVLHNAIRTALMTNFRYKMDSKEDIETEGVVGLFGRAWKQQQASAFFCDDEVPEAIGRTGEELVRGYMHEVAPHIRPAAVERPLRGVLGGVRIRAQIDLMDEDGTIIDAGRLPCSACSDHMQRFESITCSAWPRDFGVVCSDILVTGSTQQLITQTWGRADVHRTDALRTLAQEAMRRGYYTPNRGSVHCSRHQCPHCAAASRILAGWWKREAIWQHVELRNLHRC